MTADPALGAGKAATRADAQRDRILCAALKCFIEHGFHAASMASIAEAAQMSAGLMYRYFENKNAIVLAIVERQLEEKRAAIRQMHVSEDHVSRLVDVFERWCTRDSNAMSVALFLEMSAEATRNPQIAEALRMSDASARAEFQAWLTRRRDKGGAGLPAEVAATRAVLLRCVIEGLTLRAAREPDLDRRLLRAALDELFQAVLT
jgi:AcrR family transcriptional regulator